MASKTSKFKRKIAKLELDASKSSQEAMKLQKSALKKSADRIVSKIDELSNFAASNPLSFAIVAKRIDLANLVKQEFDTLSLTQVSQLETLVSDIYSSTRVEIDSMLGNSFDLVSDFQTQELLNRMDSKTILSDRIWRNNNAMSDRINNDIGRMIYQQANPEDIKRLIMKDYNVSYNAADRLFRTESSTFFNTAAIDSYKAAGLTEFEFLAESDACEEYCQPNDGKIFSIESLSSAPPLHPNCRCVVLPVIKD